MTSFLFGNPRDGGRLVRLWQFCHIKRFDCRISVGKTLAIRGFCGKWMIHDSHFFVAILPNPKKFLGEKIFFAIDKATGNH
jgi:hypothetical protein